MTSGDEHRVKNPEVMAANLARIEALSARLIAALGRRKPHDPALSGPDAELFAKAGAAWWAAMAADPARLIERQAALWGQSLQHWVEAQRLLAGAAPEAAPEAGPAAPADRRFRNPLWETHPWFRFAKSQYLMSAEAIEAAVESLDLEPREKRRAAFFARQIVDLMSPANYLATNPDALERAVATEGQSLVDGLENLVRDLEAHEGELLVTLSDPQAFRVGGNLATTPGAVVFRNRLFELIQYAPTTRTVHRTPLLLFPPWINKFYILDLRPENSLIRWLVDQGFTLFVVSWVNPDASHAGTGMEDYVEDGFLRAIAEVRAITGEAKVNATGYCIAGTTLALTLALLARRGEAPVRSASFLTTLTDFADPGEMGVFLEDDFVDGIERHVARTGVMQSFIMARTFSYLRPNDLIYAPAIRSYMMGEAPPAFDLLYWNGDSTNLPGRMAVQYLRQLCQQNRLAEGSLEFLGHRLGLRDITLPVAAVACETDHIAPWRSSFNGISQFASRERRFILAQSGHVAGVVNPPGRDKYGHYTSDAPLDDPEEWLKGARFTKGSWWPEWGSWLARRSGAQVPARVPGDAGHPVLGPAPGEYVAVRAPG